MDAKVEGTRAAASGRVLIVDDNRSVLMLHAAILGIHFDVVTASSALEAIKECRRYLPDLVVMDIEMPHMNGIDACRQLRMFSTVPVIFVTGRSELKEHLAALEAGGNDLIVKPANDSLLLHKASSAIRQHQSHQSLSREKQTLEQTAMSFLNAAGESGSLLHFMREGISCRSHQVLTRRLFECLAEMGVPGVVRLRHGKDTTVLTPHGDPTPLELSILDQAGRMGRIFQFGRQLVVNSDRITILIAKLPTDDGDPKSAHERAGKIRDNLAILAETTDALCEIVDMRVESMDRAEQMQMALGDGMRAIEGLRRDYLLMLGNARLLLHELEQTLERRIGNLGATRLEEAEIAMSVAQSVEDVLALLAEGGDFESKFGAVMDALRGRQDDGEAELF